MSDAAVVEIRGLHETEMNELKTCHWCLSFFVFLVEQVCMCMTSNEMWQKCGELICSNLTGQNTLTLCGMVAIARRLLSTDHYGNVRGVGSLFCLI